MTAPFDMIHTFDYDPYQVYASPINTGIEGAFVNDVVIHDTLSNSYMNHIEAWFKTSEAAQSVFTTLTSMGYSYKKSHPADSALETLRMIYNIDPYSEDDSDDSGYIYLVFIPITEKIAEDSHGEHYQVRGIH